MTVRIADKPFATPDYFEKEIHDVGPSWFTIHENYVQFSETVHGALAQFINSALTLTKPGDYAYGTVYAAKLDGAGRSEGEWHYDMGEYTHKGTRRFVSTWRSDGREIGNIFSLPHGELISAPNLRVTSFHEGSDFHCHPAVPPSNATGLFFSASMYREGVPANLDCPRLEALRTRGPYAELAREHAPVKRATY